MFEYRGRTLLSIKLRRLDIAVGSDVHASVLDELGRAIKKCDQRIGALHLDDDGSLDLECELIESFLGTAYVVCQAKITAVVERAAELLAAKPHEIRAMGPRFDANFSKVEVVWALGNYFKHRDEWEPSDWVTSTGLRAVTIRVLKAAGLQASSSGNLRDGAKALGNSEFSDMAVFQAVVDEWASEVASAARSATRGATLPP
jgi:hypothetical protein